MTSKLLGAVALVAFAASQALAQAWTPPRGAGSLTLSTQRIDNTGHRLTDGTLVVDGRSVNASVYVDADYAVTDRLVIGAGVPYVFARFVDPNPPPPFFPFLPVDQCRCWQRGWQDVNVAARYNVFRATSGGFAVTPSVGAGTPSHNYNYRGEAVVGRNLREMRVGLDAGYRLDPISPRVAITGSYSYAFVEQVLDIPNNRSNVSLEGGAQVGGGLAIRGWGSWQRTHGGLRVGAPPPSQLLPPGEINTADRIAEHDRLLRDNNFKAGVGVAYELRRVDLFASYVAYVSGADTHAGRAFTAGVSWPFQLGN